MNGFANQNNLASSGQSPDQLVNSHYGTEKKEVRYYLEDDKPFFLVTLVVGFFKWVFDSIQVIVIALAIFIVLYLFVISPHTIDGVSMQPNFCNKDLILADKLTPQISGFVYTDVIVFKHDENNDYIKRIVGMGGDVMRIENGSVYRNNQLLVESYLPEGRLTEIIPGGRIAEGEDYVVPEGHYFVLGDNRPNSTDSRSFGAIDPRINTIKGKVRFVLWPQDRARIFNDAQGYPVDECSLN